MTFLQHQHPESAVTEMVMNHMLYALHLKLVIEFRIAFLNTHRKRVPPTRLDMKSMDSTSINLLIDPEKRFQRQK